jgi:hypothetical protein
LHSWPMPQLSVRQLPALILRNLNLHDPRHFDRDQRQWEPRK